MKTKHLLLAIGALLVSGGLWFGNAAWRAHLQLVTLDVRNAPLREVFRKVERQTWKKIRAEKNVDGRITLHVTDKPLSYVLDRLGEQVGARWSKVYAVYDSAKGLDALNLALSGDGKLEAAGWTTIAPKSFRPDQPDGGEDERPVVSHPSGDGPGPMPGLRGQVMFRKMGNGPVIVQGGPNGQVEMWSPEEMVLESTLKARVGAEPIEMPTDMTAAETARKVTGKWTSYLAFRKSMIGIGAGGMPAGPGMNPFKRGPNDRFAKLTPQQRVLQARQRRGIDPAAKLSGP